jgi:hypothetical protein
MLGIRSSGGLVTRAPVNVSCHDVLRAPVNASCYGLAQRQLTFLAATYYGA